MLRSQDRDEQEQRLDAWCAARGSTLALAFPFSSLRASMRACATRSLSTTQRPAPHASAVPHVTTAPHSASHPTLSQYLGLLAEPGQVILRLVLRQELLDHLVDVLDPCSNANQNEPPVSQKDRVGTRSESHVARARGENPRE